MNVDGGELGDCYKIERCEIINGLRIGKKADRQT